MQAIEPDTGSLADKQALPEALPVPAGISGIAGIDAGCPVATSLSGLAVMSCSGVHHSPGRLVGSGEKQPVCAADPAGPDDDATADLGGGGDDDAAADLGGGENDDDDDCAARDDIEYITNTPRIDLNCTDLFLVE
jgi:hypothetical protein